MKKILGSLLIVAMCFSLFIPAFASEASTYSSEDILYGLTPQSTETTYNNGRKTTVSIYILDDGTKVVDTFERGVNFARSLEGSDTATRSLEISPYGTIKLTASFRWWTSSGTPGALGSIQSVECTSATGSYELEKNCLCDRWSVTHTEGAIGIGKASATATGFLGSSTVPGIGRWGKITITCTDDGAITDSTG